MQESDAVSGRCKENYSKVKGELIDLESIGELCTQHFPPLPKLCHLLPLCSISSSLWLLYLTIYVFPCFSVCFFLFLSFSAF